MSSDVSAWVGLNTRTQKTERGEVGVRAMIGVRHEPLMRVYQEVAPMLDLKSSPTIVRGLADMPGGEPDGHDFPADQDPGPLADELVGSIERIGMAWCTAHSTVTAMRDAVLNLRAFGVTSSNEQVLALLEVFCGERENAARRLRASLERRGTRTDLEAVEFGAFGRNLLAYIESLGVG